MDIWFPFVVFWVEFVPEDTEKIPERLFSTFRGAFGKALKRASCIARGYKSCVECPINQKCAYGYLFETPRPKEADRLRGYTLIPHPFTFAPPFPYCGENPLRFRITLVGRAIEYFPHVVLGLQNVAKLGLESQRVPLKLVGVIADQTGENLLKDNKIKFPQPVPMGNLGVASRILIKFLTPTTLKFYRKIVKPSNIEFHILIRNLLRRISNLSYFHAGKVLNINFKSIISEAENVVTTRKNLKQVVFKRFSFRNKNVYPLEGFVGEIEFEGKLEIFLPFLILGTYVHVGKNTSFGFGRFSITLIE